MGATFSSIQVRSDAQEPVVQILADLLTVPTYISPSLGGWVGVYPEGVEATDVLAAELSRCLAAAVFDWSVYDSDVFQYSLYDNGELQDEFNSAPGYFEGMSAEGDEKNLEDRIDPARVQGDPQVLLPYCVPGTTLAAIIDVLHPAELPEADTDGRTAQLPNFPDTGFQQLAGMLGITSDALKENVAQKMRQKYTFADHQATDLAVLLGINEELASAGYSDIDGDDVEEPAKEEFRLIGNEDLSQKYKDDKLRSMECLQNFDKISYWLKQGANPNTRERSGRPVLFRYIHQPLQVEVLLAGGADVNITSTRSPYLDPNYPEVWGHYEAGVTALMVAARLTDGQSGRVKKVVKLLLEAGADVNAHSETGRTALGEAQKMTDPNQHQGRQGRQVAQAALVQEAEVSKRVVEMLLAAGATE